jgi:hypothetical protein
VRRQTAAVRHSQRAERVCALCCVARCFGLWWFANRGEPTKADYWFELVSPQIICVSPGINGQHHLYPRR